MDDDAKATVDTIKLIYDERKRTGERLDDVVQRLRREGRLSRPSPRGDEPRSVPMLARVVEDLGDIDIATYPSGVAYRIEQARWLLSKALEETRAAQE